MNIVGLFGGSFDPVHWGHLMTAIELKYYLSCHEMRLLPCHIPPHRDGLQASSQQRLTMLQLALNLYSELQLDEREFKRQQISYSIETIEEIYSECSQDTALCLCLGADTFSQLPSWYRWRELLDYVHIVIADRPGITTKPDRQLQPMLQRALSDDVATIKRRRNGCIHRCTLLPVNISSGQIRNNFSHYQQYLTDEVKRYAQQQGLYQ